jgi:hypothetical protein
MPFARFGGGHRQGGMFVAIGSFGIEFYRDVAEKTEQKKRGMHNDLGFSD